MKLDIHSHILPESWPLLSKRYGYQGWIRLEKQGTTGCLLRNDGTTFRTVQDNTWSLESRLNEMDKHNVDVQVLSTVPVMFSYWAKPEDTLDLSRMLNDHIAHCVHRHPTRFLGLATVPLQDPILATEELKRSIVDLHLVGVQIASHVNEWNLDSRSLDPFYHVAEELNCPIFVHPWNMQTSGRMSKFWLPWLVGMPLETTTAVCSMILGGVFERFPRLKVCFAHGAGTIPYTIGRITHGHQVRPDLCATENLLSPRHYLGRFYADSLVHDAPALKLLVEVLGEGNVILGSDYPFPLGEQVPGSLIESVEEFNPRLKKMLLSENGFKFLGIEDTSRFNCGQS